MNDLSGISQITLQWM